MNSIFRYNLSKYGSTALSLPKGSQILDVLLIPSSSSGMDELACLVQQPMNNISSFEIRTLTVVGMGSQLQTDAYTFYYIGSAYETKSSMLYLVFEQFNKTYI